MLKPSLSTMKRVAAVAAYAGVLAAIAVLRRRELTNTGTTSSLELIAELVISVSIAAGPALLAHLALRSLHAATRGRKGALLVCAKNDRIQFAQHQITSVSRAQQEWDSESRRLTAIYRATWKNTAPDKDAKGDGSVREPPAK